MDRFEAMSMFLAAIEKGSLSAAARDMGVPMPTLSRKVADLETRLGAQLLIRTSRKLTLTDAGIAYATAARRILEQLAEAEHEAAGEFITPRGELVITAPVLFGRLHLLPVVSDFLEQFPEVNVRLVLGDRTLNLIDDNIDMAVRIGELPDSAMIATRIGSMRSVVCASPSLLNRHDVPRTPEEMTQKPCLATELQMKGSTWGFRLPATGAAFDVPIRPRLATSAEAVLDATLRGIGFARLRYYQIFEAIKAGKLLAVLENYEIEPAPVHLVHATRGQMPLKMRRFLDFAAPRLRKTLGAISSTA
jgi:DNA-binding transcriptional LysR family regulator